ncbi:cytochrome b/b6 domain-containing protein [Geobacter argillaceus]|uniref:4Fe-4S binding protein n=1 Tax=Geobacter argillaceus TaxID=345631 RepID=A0A562V863_9BACT|nr:cytochrome b/b6 domain-containing protein [Geobacter argillaceus]TWJ14032.1 4Fe-4S binding protein [Geobacter argillaceus]
MADDSKLNALQTNYLLDDAWSPVARFRLLSRGINDNTRLENYSQVTGDRACLACGNCIDACPVVKLNVGLVFDQNQRTSMALENHVQDECRRCYRCVNSCPQVGKELKEYVSGFRRVEKIVHLLAAFTIISLAATGITHSHYANVLSGFEANLLKYAHRTIGVISILLPVLYYRLDIKHFRRTVKKIFSWGESDTQWFRNTLSHIFSTKSDKKIVRYEFNPVQKIWYLFIMSLFPLLYLSGLGTMFMGKATEGAGLITPKLFHMVFALSFDLMLFIHVYIKFIREWIKTSFRMFRTYQETGSFVFTRGKL